MTVSIVANIAKGAVNDYAARVQGGTGAIVVIPLLASDLPADDALADYATVADLLAGAADENTTMGRKTLSSVAVSVNNTANTRSSDAADPTWTSGQMASNGGAVAKLCYAYDPNPGSGTDAELVPLVYLDCVVTPDGNAFTYQHAASGWFVASSPA